MFEKIDFVLLTVCIGILGGIANWLMSDEHTIFQFFTAIFLAGFVGFLSGLLCTEWDLSQNITFFVCGVSGLSAKIILEQSRKLLIKKIVDKIDKSL